MMIADPREEFRKFVLRRKREHLLSIACGVVYAIAIAVYMIWVLS